MIRSATTADADAVVALESECQGADAWSDWLVRDGLGGGLPTVRYLVADDGDHPVGYAVVSCAGDIAELQRIGVTAGRRRTGIASALLGEALVVASRSGANRLLLEVRVDNAPALAFYASHGFIEIDRRPRYYRDGTTAVVLRIPLVKGCG